MRKISFTGSKIVNSLTGQSKRLSPAELQTIINQELVPYNNGCIATMNKLLVPRNISLYNYMVKQAQKYLNEYYRIITAYQNSKEDDAIIYIEADGIHFPKYADNCYEYSVRDAFDRVLGTMNNNRYWYRNPGSVSKDSRNYSQIGQLVCKDLEVCKIKSYQFSSIQEVSKYYDNPQYTALCWIYGTGDYHFYRYEPQFKVWTHKPGMTCPVCYDANQNLITNPQNCKWSSIYSSFGGYILAEIPASW